MLLSPDISLSASAAARRMSSKVGLSAPEVFGGIPRLPASWVRPTKRAEPDRGARGAGRRQPPPEQAPSRGIGKH